MMAQSEIETLKKVFVHCPYFALNRLTSRTEGIEVIAFSAKELGRGRGCSHCMVCPLERAQIC